MTTVRTVAVTDFYEGQKVSLDIGSKCLEGTVTNGTIYWNEGSGMEEKNFRTGSSPRPWRLVWDWDIPAFSNIKYYPKGVMASDDTWVYHFDENYGNNAVANAELIIGLVNGNG
jgi:hypothetical protein